RRGHGTRARGGRGRASVARCRIHRRWSLASRARTRRTRRGAGRRDRVPGSGTRWRRDQSAARRLGGGSAMTVATERVHEGEADVVVARRPLKGSLALVAFAIGGLARRRGKTAALVGSLALTVALAAAVLFLTDALRGAAERVRAAAPDLVVQRLVAGRPATIDAKLVEGLGRIDPVREARRRMCAVRDSRGRVWGYVFVPPLQANVVVTGARAGIELREFDGALAP